MLTADFTNTDSSVLGLRGIDLAREAGAWGPRLEALVTELLQRSADPAAMLGWLKLPEDRELVASVKEIAASLPAGLSDLVVLGIGGSSLGALAVTSALQHPYRLLQKDGTGLRVHFVDNVDSDQVRGLLDVLDPASTVVNVISKSGTTAETMAAYMLFRSWLQARLGEGYAGHVVATTDPESGILRPLAEQRGYRLLSVPPSVGGRFSVLSAVGLLPIALAGIDVDELLAGAADANGLVQQPYAENPVLQAALIQYLSYRRGRTISVLMPYSSRLRYLTDWFVQLWAESLGKAVDRHGSRVNEGSTPLGAIGATDQHSQVQLFNEGPDNKLVAFVRVEEPDARLVIPAPEPAIAELDYLAGRRFDQLLGAEQAATAHALLKHGKPNYTLSIPGLDARNLGLLLQFLMWQTAVMGELTGINTYDQPGVELGKVYTYALMGRDGFDEERSELKAAGIRPQED